MLQRFYLELKRYFIYIFIYFIFKVGEKMKAYLFLEILRNWIINGFQEI